MNQAKLKLFWHSVKQTRLKQLWHRARLLIKRKLLVRVMSASQADAAAWHDPTGTAVSSTPAVPVLPDRLHHVVRHGESDVVVKFLNREREMALPFDWRPEELRTGTRLWLLNLHYHEFLESIPGPLATRVMLDWIDQVKPYVPGYWLDTWNSYSMSIRVVVWMQLLASDRLPLSDDDRRTVTGSLLAQMRFLKANLELDIGGNHLLKNIKALLWGGRYFDGAEAERWQALGERLLQEELAEQILPDGMHYELSPTYHNQVLADLLDCYQALNDSPLKTHLAERLATMAQLAADFRHPDGGVSLFNDAGLYFAYQPAEVLDAWQQIFGQQLQPNRLITYPSSGYYGLRHADDLFLADCAALAPDFLPAHGHGDALSFEWSVGGNRIFTDPGVFEYADGDMRAYSRATSSHNTVTIDEQDQSEFWKSFRVGRRARITACRHTTTDDGFALQGAHDGYTRLEGAPTHQRAFTVTPDAVSFTDTVTGGSGQACVSTLLLHPDCSVTLDGDTAATVINGSVTVRVETDARMRLEKASYHPDHGHHLDTHRLVTELGKADGSLTHETRLTVQNR